MDELLDEDSLQIRDVYAHYGLAMFLAQCLEHGIVNALLHAKLLPQERARAGATRAFTMADFQKRFDIFMDEQFELTMGGLVSRLRTSITLPPGFEAELTKAKELRNFLAHRYFRERAEEFISNRGRKAMLVELQKAQQLFERLDEELKTAADSFAKALGMSLTKQEQRVAEYMAQAYARAAALDATEEE
ncbi:MAG: hypothetical protein ACLPPF_12355 [Rhodomicrobium sp.]